MNSKTRISACLTLWIVFLFASSCAKKEEKLDLGTVQGHVYNNRYFRLSLKVPDTWNVQDNETKKKLMAQGRKAAAGGNDSLGEKLDASALDSVNLLTMFQYPPGAQVSSNPAFVVMADKLTQYPGIKRGSDYLSSARALLERTKLSVSFISGVSSQSLGGVAFDTMEARIKTPKLLVTQKYYAVIKKNYALVLITSYTTDKELQALNGILQSISFQ